MSNRNITSESALRITGNRLESADFWAPYEVHFSFGDSQASGSNTDTAFDATLDSFDGRISELSQNVARIGYTIPAAGELIPARHPDQGDVTGSGDIGPMLPYLRRRMQMFPGIRRIFVVNAAVGGTSATRNGEWGVGETLYNGLVSDVNSILEEYPEAVPVSALCSLGTVDASDFDQPTLESTLLTSLEAIFAGLRSSIHNGSSLSFAIVGMPQWFLNGAAIYSGVDRVHREIARKDGLVTVIETQDLDRSDLLHFTGADYRQIGQRVAAALAPIITIPYRVMHRFRYDPLACEWRDIWGGAYVYGGAMTIDSERGPVLDVSGTGFRTSARISAGTEYTISLKIRPTSSAGNRNLVSFLPSSGETIGQAFAMAGSCSVLHEGAAAGTTNTLVSGGEPALNTWHTVGCCWRAGETIPLYLNGVKLATEIDAALAPALTERQLNFGGWDVDNLANNAFTGQMDDIVIVDRKLSDAGMARLHWS